MNHPRVAQVLAGAEHGGAENFYVRLVQGLHRSAAIDQKAFIRNHPERVATLQDCGLDVEGFRFGGPLHVVDRMRFKRSLNTFSPDIVMTWMNRASGLTPRGPYQLVCRLGHYYNLKYYRHADYWVGISKGICDHLVRGGMAADNVVHIPNFADETPVTALSRRSFNTPVDRPLLLAAGRLHVNKGFDTLLQALTLVPDAVLWLAGTGPQEQALKKLCHDLGLDERVRFLGWRSDVTALMHTADLFVCPSRHEGLGSIVMESWAHHCPIVATNSQGPGEVIETGETGLVVPVDQPQPLAEAIRQLLTDPAARRRLADNGYRHYCRDYSQEVIVRRYEEFYASILP
jgi:glycosyltransferase involved in cell wall biosynthesis